MTVKDFSEYYGVDIAAVHVSINQGVIPKSVLYKPSIKSVWHVNTKFFERRKEFRKKVQMFIHDMYYFHFHPWFNDSEIGRMCGVSNTVIADKMWTNLDSQSIFRYKISGDMWKIFRYFRMVERVCYKRYNPEFNVRKALYWQEEEEKTQSSVNQKSLTMELQRKISA